MIRKFKISVFRFIKNEMTNLSTYPKLVTFFRGLMAPFDTMAKEWDTFRDASITRALVTGESASLAWYLNQLYDPTLRRIYIATAPGSGVVAGLPSTEPTKYFVAGLPGAEPTKYAVIGLYGEDSGFMGYSFIVFFPSAIISSLTDMIGTVNQYRLAGKTFFLNPF
jgi:hypothetical protein